MDSDSDSDSDFVAASSLEWYTIVTFAISVTIFVVFLIVVTYMLLTRQRAVSLTGGGADESIIAELNRAILTG